MKILLDYIIKEIVTNSDHNFMKITYILYYTSIYV